MSAVATTLAKTNLHDMDFEALRDYFVGALADRQKAQAVMNASRQAPLLERFTGSERVMLQGLFGDILNNHARA